jgi:hypothetical protein
VDARRGDGQQKAVPAQLCAQQHRCSRLAWSRQDAIQGPGAATRT